MTVSVSLISNHSTLRRTQIFEITYMYFAHHFCDTSGLLDWYVDLFSRVRRSGMVLWVSDWVNWVKKSKVKLKVYSVGICWPRVGPSLALTALVLSAAVSCTHGYVEFLSKWMIEWKWSKVKSLSKAKTFNFYFYFTFNFTFNLKVKYSKSKVCV